MAALFTLFSLSLLASYFGKKSIAITTWLVTIVLASFMLWHHANSTLQILL